jgi:hypothetical protein
MNWYELLNGPGCGFMMSNLPDNNRFFFTRSFDNTETSWWIKRGPADRQWAKNKLVTKITAQD